MRVSIIHLDLGIGGAERLIVNFATVIKELNHEITLITSHHDQTRCFPETTHNGILGKYIRVYGDWLPRHICGRFTALCAIVRMLYLSAQVAWISRQVDVVIIDGVSAPIPILQFAGIPVLFYCHYPDKLLCVQRRSIWKRLYREVIDWVEDVTTGCADVILVNSDFTANAFRTSFKSLGAIYHPEVLYPTVELPDVSELDRKHEGTELNKADAGSRVLYARPNRASFHDVIPYAKSFRHIFVSINRFERKKNISLAIQSFLSAATARSSTSQEDSMLLVVAGGCDDRVAENVDYLKELKEVVIRAGFQDRVTFRPNIGNEEKKALLLSATALLYTPHNEHFGIVPLEAMALRCPVIAVNSGGPLETVVDEVTGFLCEPNEDAFSMSMLKLVTNPLLVESLGNHGRETVEQKFTLSCTRVHLDRLLEKARRRSSTQRVQAYLITFAAVSFWVFAVVIAIFAMLVSCL